MDPAKPVTIAVVREQALDERRVAATPETVKKFISLGAGVVVEAGAGLNAAIADADFRNVGALVAKRDVALGAADIVLAVQGPTPATLQGVRPGAWLVGNLAPLTHRGQV
jgi:NAD(P) transhydrogenase subunit alpha